MENYNEGLKKRINALLHGRRISQNSLAADCRISQKTVNNQLSNTIQEKDKAKVSLEVVMALLDRCPDVSAEWLLRGKETKAQPSVTSVGDNSIANNNNTTVNDSEALRCLIQQLKEKDKQLEEKGRQIDRLLHLLERQQVG